MPVPDLTVTELVASNKTFMYGINSTNGTINYYKVNLRANVKNIGIGSAGNSYTKLEIIGYNSTNLFTSMLNASQSVNVQVAFIVPQGSKIARASADILGNVNESNEANNVLIVNFTLP